MAPINAVEQGRRGILFDLDGVLWHTSRLHEQAFVEVGLRHGLESVDYERLAGRPTPAAWRLVLEANKRSADPDLVRKMTVEKQELARRWLRADPPMCDEIPLLACLPRSEVSLGLVTGASSATASIFLRASGVDFEVVITGESVSEGKPSPAPYAAAVSQLHLDSHRCWVLEDSVQGIESASLAGTRCVHLTEEGESCLQHHPKVEACVESIRGFLSVAGIEVPG